MSYEQIAADLQLVVTHVLRDEACQYGVRSNREHGALAVRVAETGFANRAEVSTVVNWVLAAMKWTVRTRALTDDEVLVYSAAIRTADIIQMFDGVAVLGQAIRNGDWDAARKHWLHLARFHTWLIAASPDAAYLSVLLQDLTQPSIH